MTCGRGRDLQSGLKATCRHISRITDGIGKEVEPRRPSGG